MGDDGFELNVDDFEHLTQPWSWLNVAVVTAAFAAEVLDAAARAATHLTTLLAASSNYQQDQRAFREAAALEIETITQED